MKGNVVVVGVFDFLDDTIKAIKFAKESKLDYRVYSPTTQHEIEAEAFPEKSPVRKITFAGGLIGTSCGWALAVLCSMDWPMRVSAKDVVSLPGFFVIGYECLILFAALATFGAILHFCRLPDILRKVGYDPRFSDDKFGVVVGCDQNQADQVKGALTKVGAQEVEVREGL